MSTTKRPWLLLGALALALAGLHGQAAQAQTPATDVPVQPGDRFVIRFLGESATLQPIVIDDRMMLELPLAGRLSVQGLSAHAATDSARARLMEFRRDGAVSVSFERRIAVLGDVRRPDIYYMDMTVRLRAALAMAGGVAESGRTREVLLLRDGVQTRIIDWRTSSAGEMELRSGDELVVPRERWIKRNVLTLVSGAGVIASIIIAFVLR